MWGRKATPMFHLIFGSMAVGAILLAVAIMVIPLWLGPLAQLPISVFLNNTLQQTVTINGTEGKAVEQSVTLAIRQDGEKYMKLYFGESGIDMHRMFLRYVGKNDIESFRNE